MVNIAKLAGFAEKLLHKPAALAVGTGIAGLTVGIPIGRCTGDAEVGDSFEKKPKTELKTDSTNVTKPEAKEEKPKFEYKPPKIGERGIVRADTMYYENNGNIAGFMYLDRNNKVVREEHLNDDGTVRSFAHIYHNEDGSSNENWYDKDGEFDYSIKRNKDGSYEQEWLNDDCETVKIQYDKNGNEIKEKRYDIDGKLKYTVIPKYNKEGDIVKRDTIRNE